MVPASAVFLFEIDFDIKQERVGRGKE